MAQIQILLKHSGRWDKFDNYIDFVVDAIAINPDSNFQMLRDTVAKQLNIDLTTKIVKIKYKVMEKSPGLEIHNDMGVLVYTGLKIEKKGIEIYPLCITVEDIVEDQGFWSDRQSIRSRDTVGDCVDTARNSCNINTNIDDTIISSAETVELLIKGTCDEHEVEEVAVITNSLQNEIVEGQVYINKNTVVMAMKRFAITEKIQFKVERSSKTSYCLICKGENCKWKFRASSLNSSSLFKVREFTNEHTCPYKERVYGQAQLTSRMIGMIVKDRVDDPKSTYKPKEIMDEMQRCYGIHIDYMKAWRAKEMAIAMIRGDPTESYKKLPSYLYMLEQRNPGSVVALHASEDHLFKYAFVALNASIKGFQHCKPIVVVDGSFLKAAHKGTFLAASTLDAAGSILPLAYAIVDSENDASWQWFFEKFKYAYGERENMCVVSDRNESIIKATTTVYPQVPHYACIWHLWNNLKTKFKKCEEKLHETFFSMAKAYTIQEFDIYMNSVEKMDKRIKAYLLNAGYQKWSRAHSTVNRGFTMTSNIAESLNAVNRDARDMPVVAFMEYMRSLIGTWTDDNRKKAHETFTPLGFKYNKILDGYRSRAMQLKIHSTGNEAAIYDGEKKFIVNLNERTCCCGKFQMEELPCVHALAILKYKGLEEEDYSCNYYLTKSLVKTYEFHVNPIPDESRWEIPAFVSEIELLPPVARRPPGRPKTTRYKPQWEVHAKRTKITCANCGREGHNRKTCTHPPKPK